VKLLVLVQSALKRHLLKLAHQSQSVADHVAHVHLAVKLQLAKLHQQ
jgi:hypothetical protein